MFDNYVNPSIVVHKEGVTMEHDLPNSSQHDKKTEKGDGFEEYVQAAMKAPIYEPEIQES